jgi:GT2 family glycosyltransferase
MTVGAVVVPTFGRRELVWTCVRSLLALDPAPPFAVVVDGNAEPLELPFELPSWLHVLREPNRGPGHARNTGYLAAIEQGADVVCFLDDDAVAPPSWFADHLRAHEAHPRAGAVGGAIENLTSTSLASEHLHRTTFAPERGDAGPVRMLPSVNLSYKRVCLEEVGLFDSAMAEGAGEDVDHCARLRAAGWDIWFEPGIVVGHHYPTSMRGLLRRQDWYGRGFVNTRSRHPELPGADFLALPWWRAVAGTVPHLARSGWRAGRDLGLAHGPVEVACQAAYRWAAWKERRRLEQEAS